MTTIIRADYLAQVHPFISTKETLYYLCGAYIAPNPTGGVRIVATDGQALGIFHDANGHCDGEHIWPISKGLLAACKAAKRDNRTRWLVIQDGRAVVVLATTADEAAQGAVSNDPAVVIYQELIQPIDGTFPDYMRAIPSFDSNLPAIADAYNPALLARVASPGKFEADGTMMREGRPARLFVNRIGEPAIVKIADRDDFMGVIMPVRWTGDADRPEWMRDVAPVEAPAPAEQPQERPEEAQAA